MALDHDGVRTLLGAVNLALRAAEIEFQVGHQDNDQAHNLSFQRQTRTGRQGALYCHLLYSDPISGAGGSNLVFRFRTGSTPRDWFRVGTVPRLTRDWARRFSLVYTAAQGTPRRSQEPGEATAQYGIELEDRDLHASSLHDTLVRFLLIANESVREGARREQNRDWTEFDNLVR